MFLANSAHFALAGLDAESNTDGFNPVDDLDQIAEDRRQSWIARQHGVNAAMIWSSGYVPGDLWGPPLGGPPLRQPIGYESKQVAPNRWIYRPRYAEEIAPAAPGSVLPTPAAPGPTAPAGNSAPARPGPSDPDAFDLPRAKAPAGGPREF